MYFPKASHIAESNGLTSEAGSFKNQNLGRFLCRMIQFPKGQTIVGAQSSLMSQIKGENHHQNITQIRILHFIYEYFH